MVHALLRRACPNCGGEISDERLARGLPCEACLPEAPREGLEPERIERLLEKEGNLKEYAELAELERKVKKFAEFFVKRVGSPPWSLQLAWARRLLSGRSFAILAPTGVGKTTFGLVASLFLPGKAYLIFPTRALVEQASRRLEALGLEGKRVAAIAGDSAESKKARKMLEEGRFDILVTTSMFLYRNLDLIPKGVFDLVFVDDVDSFLKTARNVDKALLLLGFTEEDINLAFKSLQLKNRASRGEEVWDELREVQRRLSLASSHRRGVLIVSSATSDPKSQRVNLFRELLGFEVGRTVYALRNVEDVFEECPEGRLFERVAELARELGPGGLIYLPSDRGKEEVRALVEFLNEKGIPCASYEEIEEALPRFEAGELQALVGIASYRNPLARGIDLPSAVRYALFVGVPKLRFEVDIEAKPFRLLWLLLALKPILKGREQQLDHHLRSLSRYSSIPEERLEEYPKAATAIESAREFVRSMLERPEIREAIRSSDELTLSEVEGRLFIVVADITGYLQASGRTSRLYAGGLTKGLAYLLVEDRKAFTNLKRKMRWFAEEVEFRPANEVDLPAILERIDEDRRKVREVLEGRAPPEAKQLLRTALVIVESPNKARTIANFFGRPLRRKVGEVEVLEVLMGDKALCIAASKGHVLDLVTDVGFFGVVEKDGRFVPVYDAIARCRKCNQQFVGSSCPRCNGPPDEDRLGIVRSLQKLAQEVEEVYIATDPDTEGEKIAWDVFLALRPFQPNLKRAEFHEVTKRAFVKALAEARSIDQRMVEAQIVRRVADRWVGFSLSQKLWEEFEKHWLSAGRVQTPVLGWVIEREAETRRKRAVIFLRGGGILFQFDFGEEVQKAKQALGEIERIQIEVLEEREEVLAPPPPFTTSTMLTEASSRLKYSAQKTMELAQDLFEAGLITYHRTDSTRVSSAGISVAREYILENFGEEWFKGRSWGEGGAHECIRPAKPMDVDELRALLISGTLRLNLTREHLALYGLIFRRFMASQMREAKVRRRKIRIKAGSLEREEEYIVALLDEGFTKLLPVRVVPLREGSFIVEEKQLRLLPSARPFTQGDLVSEMKKRGLGRPSTYAQIVQRLLDKGYVVERNGYLWPTAEGKRVYKYLLENFPKYTSEDFTRELEALMDKVESGEADYQKILRDLSRVREEVGLPLHAPTLPGALADE